MGDKKFLDPFRHYLILVNGILKNVFSAMEIADLIIEK